MTQRGPFRLPTHTARGRCINFRFDGRRLVGLEGDSLAAALLANGVRTISRSFKFRRPRGVFSAGIEEPNALVQLHSGASAVPSERATMVPAEEGLEAFSQGGWPSVSMDVGRILDLAPSLWAAGFYNKTFMWPSWHVYEGIIRRLAGVGRAPAEPDPDRYDARNAHCDVLVIGGGVAGLAAALAAAQSGARVILAEQGRTFGGQASWDGSTIGGIASERWVRESVKRLEQSDRVRLLSGAAAVGYYDHDVVTLLETVSQAGSKAPVPRERYWIVRTGRVILATGAIEQPLIFCNNDRPGILLTGAAREYVRRYGVAPGRRIVIATNNDSAYAAARDLREAGIEIPAITDTRAAVPATLVGDMSALGIAVHGGTIPIDTSGFAGLKSVTVGRLTPDGRAVGATQTFDCDALAVSGGFSPVLHLYAQAGGKLTYQERSGALEPVSQHASIRIAGRAAVPSLDLESALRHASFCGECAAAEARSAEPANRHNFESVSPRGAADEIGTRVSPAGKTTRQWVDLRHDVTVADLQLALRENYTSIEHIKRYTTVGMSLDQGKTSSAPALEVVARLREVPPSVLGHTTYRPPFVPVTFGAIAAGRRAGHFAPSRRTPMHDWHVAHGALIEDFGEWRRPAAYLRPGEGREEAIRREARAVRGSVGLFDASTLGKIEVHGPDAQEFLDRFYINNLATLKMEQARYVLMLRENGTVFDDGTVTMLAPGHLLVTTTSGNASRVAAWFEEWRQCEWPQLNVAVTEVTDQWGTVSLSGPLARPVFERLNPQLALANEAFPHLRMQQGEVLGCPARVYRVSFSGELTYEINVPADSAQLLWDALMDAGRADGIQPYGVDALLLMRLEKGFLHVGSETDGTTIPDDVGYGKVAANKPRDFIGRRSLALPENTRADRLQLVGLASADDTDIQVGSHLRLPGSTNVTDGWVTSAGRTVAGNEPIALALLRAGRQQMSSVVTVHDSDRVTRARVLQPPFYDPKGERMNG